MYYTLVILHFNSPAFSIDLQNQVLLAQTSATKKAICSEPMLLVANLLGNAKKNKDCKLYLDSLQREVLLKGPILI